MTRKAMLASGPNAQIEDQCRRITLTAAFSELVRDHLDRPPPELPRDASCGDVVRVMRESLASSVLIVDREQRILGIVTERDVAQKMAYRLDAGIPVNQIMSSPVLTIREDDYLYHAISIMRRRDLRHLPVVDRARRVTGVLHLHRALAQASCRLMEQIDRLTHEETLEGLQQVKSAQVEVADELFEEEVPVPEIQALLTQVNNDIYRRMLEFHLRQMKEEGWGEPPVSFSTIVMGSGGRGESFLFPDQDNGFILAEYPDRRHAMIDAFFIELAARLTRTLDGVGITLCRGHVMATNPLWRKTLSQWRQQILYWFRKSSPKILRLMDIFFDFESVFGQHELSDALREDITRITRGQLGFLREMQRIQDNHGVALGLFGRLTPDNTPGPHKGKLNLKYHGLLPLVESIRLLSLREGVPYTSTLARIDALYRMTVLDRNEQDYLSGAFYLLTRLILRQQLNDYKAKRQVTAYVSPAELSARDEDMLKDGLRAIDELKNRVRTEFTADIF